MPKAGNVRMDYASLIPFISPDASAYSSASDYVDVDSSLTAPVVANSPATVLISRVANLSFDTSGVTRILHDVDTNTEAAIPVDPNALHRYNDIVANPEIAYDIIRRSIESQARMETDNELNSQDAVVRLCQEITTRILDIEIARLAKNRYCIAVQLYTIHKRPSEMHS